MPEYIDREEVYRKACRGCTRSGDETGSCYEEEPCNDLQFEFASAPAADVAPVRHGKWKIIRPGEWTATFRCSECGRHITVDPKLGDPKKNYPYCHCGAKMDGRD